MPSRTGYNYVGELGARLIALVLRFLPARTIRWLRTLQGRSAGWCSDYFSARATALALKCYLKRHPE